MAGAEATERLVDYYVCVGFGENPTPLEPPKWDTDAALAASSANSADSKTSHATSVSSLDRQQSTTSVFTSIARSGGLGRERKSGSAPQSFMDIAFKGDVLDRFPLVDHRGLQFPPGLELFCIPDGLHLYSAPALPRIHYFACQALNGDRLYGICLTFFEQVQPDLLAKLKVYDNNNQQGNNNESTNTNKSSPSNSTNSFKDSPSATPTPTPTAASATNATATASGTTTAATAGATTVATTTTTTTTTTDGTPEVSTTAWMPDDTIPLRPRGTAFTISSNAPLLMNSTPPTTNAAPIAAATNGSVTPSSSSDNLTTEGQPPPVVPKRPILASSSSNNLNTQTTTAAATVSPSAVASPAKTPPLLPPRPPTGSTVPINASSFSTPNRGGVATGSGSQAGATPSIGVNASSPSVSTSRVGHISTMSTTSIVSPTKKARAQPIYAPKCIGLLSHFPFLAQFRQFLTEMYRLSITPSKVPLERILCNFMQEVPLPPLGQLKVEYSISDQKAIFARPPANDPISLSPASLRLLFDSLDHDTIVTLLECVLKEKKILLLSTQLSNLGSIAEAIVSLAYPFRWQHVYIPLLPKAMLDYLNAPMPFIMGAHPSYVTNFDELDPDLFIFDLDKHKLTSPKLLMAPPLVSTPSTAGPNTTPTSLVARARAAVGQPSGTQHPSILATLGPGIPSHDRSKLISTMRSCSLFSMNTPRTSYEKKLMENLDLAFHYAPSPAEMEEERTKKKGDDEEAKQEYNLRQAFYRLFVSLFKDYRPHLIMPTDANPYPDPSFQIAAFLLKHPKSSHPFLEEFLHTQCFQHFVEERTFPSKDDSHVKFFDESIVQKLNRSKLTKNKPTPFLDDKSTAITKTFMCPAPDMSGLPNHTYRYEFFPKLSPALYTPPRLGPAAAGTQLKRTGTASQLKETAGQDQTVHTVWFMIFASLMARGSHVEKGIDLAFQVISNMRKAGIAPDDRVWELLMQVCAAGGSPEKSLKLLAEMESVGFTADAQSYSSLLHVLARHPGTDQHAINKSINGEKQDNHTPAITVPQSIVSAVADLKKNWGNAPASSGSSSAAALSVPATNGNLAPSPTGSEKKTRSMSNASPLRPKPGYYESLFEHLFPGLSLTTSDSCPKCHKAVKDYDIRDGWNADPQDYTTQCSVAGCKERFVARFTVRLSTSATQAVDMDEETAKKNTIYCEYLSPYVLRKEIGRILEASGPELLCTEEFRRTSPSIFWNLTWHLSNYRLPVDFLLFHFSKSVTTSTPVNNGTTAATTTAATATATDSSASSASSPTAAAAGVTVNTATTGHTPVNTHHTPHPPSTPSPSLHPHLTPQPPTTSPPDAAPSTAHAVTSPHGHPSSPGHFHPHPPANDPPVLAIAGHSTSPATTTAATATTTSTTPSTTIAFGGAHHPTSPVLGPTTFATTTNATSSPVTGPRTSFILHPPSSSSSLLIPSPNPNARRLSFGAPHALPLSPSPPPRANNTSAIPTSTTTAASTSAPVASPVAATSEPSTSTASRPSIKLVSVTRSAPLVDTSLPSHEEHDSPPSSPDSTPITFYPLPDSSSPQSATTTSLSTLEPVPPVGHGRHSSSGSSDSGHERLPIVLHLPTDQLQQGSSASTASTPVTGGSASSLMSPSSDDRVTLYAFAETPSAASHRTSQ